MKKIICLIMLLVSLCANAQSTIKLPQEEINRINQIKSQMVKEIESSKSAWRESDYTAVVEKYYKEYPDSIKRYILEKVLVTYIGYTGVSPKERAEIEAITNLTLANVMRKGAPIQKITVPSAYICKQVMAEVEKDLLALYQNLNTVKQANPNNTVLINNIKAEIKHAEEYYTLCDAKYKEALDREKKVAK